MVVGNKLARRLTLAWEIYFVILGQDKHFALLIFFVFCPHLRCTFGGGRQPDNLTRGEYDPQWKRAT